jgi:hypothetical protein
VENLSKNGFMVDETESLENPMAQLIAIVQRNIWGHEGSGHLERRTKMPKITAYGKTFRDWEGLLGAVERNAATISVDEALKTELSNLLAKVREIKVEQEDLLGKSRGMTQVLRQTVDDGKEVARKIRALVLGRLGSKTELLKQYGIPPGRRRARTAKTSQPPTVEKPKKNEELPGNSTEPSGR